MILLSIAGTIGISVVVPENLGKCNSNQDIAKLKIKNEFKEEINPYYISSFLNSKIGKMQIQRASTGSTHPHIFIYSIKSFLIPIPPLNIQDDIAKIMTNAYLNRREGLQVVDKLLESLDDFILNKLSINLPQKQYNYYFFVEKEKLKDRIDASYYNPRYFDVINTLKKDEEIYIIKKLGDVVDFSKDYFDPISNCNNSFKYIEISDIDNKTGVIKSFDEILCKDAPSRARRIIHKDDILIPKLSGTLKSIAIVPNDLDGAIATTGFEVARPKNINGCYLHTILRNIICQVQLNQKTTGTIMASISRDNIGSIYIPYARNDIQEKIVEEVKNRSNTIKTLVNNGGDIIANAKEEIERIILGGAHGTRRI